VNGPTLPAEVVRLALDLERRGVPLRTDQEHRFMVPTDPRLTAANRQAIQRWKHHLGAVVEYQVPELG
jgi:hypothetical protein